MGFTAVPIPCQELSSLYAVNVLNVCVEYSFINLHLWILVLEGFSLLFLVQGLWWVWQRIKVPPQFFSMRGRTGQAFPDSYRIPRIWSSGRFEGFDNVHSFWQFRQFCTCCFLICSFFGCVFGFIVGLAAQ